MTDKPKSAFITATNDASQRLRIRAAHIMAFCASGDGCRVNTLDGGEYFLAIRPAQLELEINNAIAR